MGPHQLTVVDATSETDPLQAFLPEADVPVRLPRWSRLRGFVELPVPPGFRAATEIVMRKRRSRFYRRWIRRMGGIPYPVFVLGFAVGAFAGGMASAPPKTAVIPRVAAVPARSTDVKGVSIENDRALGTAGIEQPRAVDASSAVTEVLPTRPKAPVRAVRNLAAAAAAAPAAHHFGTLRVDSTPSSADVYLNGSLAGQTPLVLRKLPVGSRAVRVSLDGYANWSRAVRIVADQTTPVSARLDRKR